MQAVLNVCGQIYTFDLFDQVARFAMSDLLEDEGRLAEAQAFRTPSIRRPIRMEGEHTFRKGLGFRCLLRPTGVRIELTSFGHTMHVIDVGPKCDSPRTKNASIVLLVANYLQSDLTDSADSESRARALTSALAGYLKDGPAKDFVLQM